MRSASHASFSVLLIEDDVVQRMSAADALREAGMDVVESGGIDGAVVALDAMPDLRAVITDVNLVGEAMTGFTLARVIAARWPQVALLITSGAVEPARGQMPAGARFLRKPFEGRELASAVFSLVERRAIGMDDHVG